MNISKHTIQKNIDILLLSFLIFSTLVTPILAESLDVLTRADWGVDESLYQEEKKFGEVNKVNLVVVDSNSLEIRDDCKSWANSLYYYFTTRLGTKDIPFAYLACQDGTILEGSKQKEERSFEILGGEGAINIPILTTSSSKALDAESYAKLETFIISLSEKFVIKKIEIKKLQVDLSVKNKTVKLSLVPLSTPITGFDSQVLLTLPKLKQANRKIQLAVKEATIANTNVKPAELIDVKINVTNNSGFNIYGRGDNALFAVTDTPFDGKSDFYAGSDFWSSLSRIQLLEDNEIILDKETKDLLFKVKIPLKAGKLAQNFVVTNKAGTKIAGTSFKVEVTSNMDGMDVIEIKSTENGKLNVRDVPNGSNIITKVFPKERYVVYARQDGWLQIDVGGTKGWILATYANSVTK
ncbi:MAG: SH3 domain-containing protein, partial [bacterium]